MPKQKVTSDLLGKWIRPIPAFGNPAGDPLSVDVNKRIWSGIVPDSDGLFRAKIVAVWQEEGTIKVAAADSTGNVSDFWIKNVQLEV
jgi:hypothetical protein